LKEVRLCAQILITDKLAGYGAAKGEVMPFVEHRKHKGLNNRSESSHRPTQGRERQMKRFKSVGQAQRFLAAHDRISNLFHLRRDYARASECRAAGSVHSRCGPTSAELLPQFELRAKAAFSWPRDDNLMVPA